MIREQKIHHVIVVEPDIDRMAASLYAVDWEELAGSYNAREGRTFHFIVGAQEEEYLVWASTWNRLIQLCPHFPVTTLFYNHQGKEMFDRISDKVNRDLIVFLMSWGHYDDEIRQINYALHNFHKGVKELPKAMETSSYTPVCIVGAGPSLDQRYESLKKIRDKVIIFSCGTSLRTLTTYGIEPDFHVELESDLMAYITLTRAADEATLKKLKIIGPSHISPLIYEVGADARMYYKSESVTASLFGTDSGNIILNATPTCTNAALAIAMNLGFRNIFLFGLDFGFKDKDQHHSKGSIYYEKLIKLEHEYKDLVEIKAVDGSRAFSTPNYFTSKRKAENIIKSFSLEEDLKVYSCSDVAEIEETEWLEQDEFIEMVESLPNSKEEDMAYVFNEDATVNNLANVNDKLKYIEENLKALSSDINQLLSKPIDTLEDLSLTCGTINWYLESILQPRTPEFYFFVRGAVRHYLCVGYAHAFATTDKEKRLEYIENWREAFKECFASKPEHFANVVYKDFDTDTDLWIKQSSMEAEDAVNPFFTKDYDDLEYDFY